MILLLRLRWMFLILAIASFGGGWFFAPLIWLGVMLTLVWGATWLSRPRTRQYGG